jgi:hypothetical protein
MMMSDKPDGKRRGWVRTVAWIAVSILVIYPLSIGPVAWLTDKIDSSHKGLPTVVGAIVYRPVAITARLTGTDDALWRYIAWFIGPHPRGR